MTPIDLLIFALGAGAGCCVGYVIGHIAGRREGYRSARDDAHLTRFAPLMQEPDLEEPDCVMPPAPVETDWEDFEQRTGLRDTERTYGLMPSGFARHMTRY